MMQLLITIAPIFIIIAIGALSKYIKLADDKWIEVLNKFALYFAFPVLIFSSLAGLESRAAIDYSLFIYNSILLVVAFAAVYVILLCIKIRKEIRNCYLMCAVFGNTAYLGFPYVTSVIPNSGGAVSIIVASYIILMFTMGLWILEKSSRKKTSFVVTLKHIIKNPLLLAVIFGILFVQLNLKLPLFLDKSIKMLGAGASPVVLFALGIFLVRKIQFNKKLFHSLIITAVKLIALPIVFIIFYAYFIKDTSSAIAIIESGMPTALTWFALSQIYPMDKTIVVYTIIVSTVLSVVALPILTMLVL